MCITCLPGRAQVRFEDDEHSLSFSTVGGWLQRKKVGCGPARGSAYISHGLAAAAARLGKGRASQRA